MPTTAILFGVILIALGIVGYVMTGQSSVTALIPSFFGIALAGLGLAANAKESLRKHLMHAAVVVALLGFIATAGRLVSKIGELTYSAAVVSQVSMALVCLLFVILGVKSFADARRRNNSA